MLLFMSGIASIGQPQDAANEKMQAPSPRSPDYVSFRANQLRRENEHLNLPSGVASCRASST